MVGDQDQVGIKLWSRELVGVDVDDPPRALQAEGIVSEPRDSHRVLHRSRPVPSTTTCGVRKMRPAMGPPVEGAGAGTGSMGRGRLGGSLLPRGRRRARSALGGKSGLSASANPEAVLPLAAHGRRLIVAGMGGPPLSSDGLSAP